MGTVLNARGQLNMRGEHPVQHGRNVEMTRNSLEDRKRSRRQLTTRR